MNIKELLETYRQDPMFKTLVLLTAIIGFMLLFVSVADHFSYLGNVITR